MHKDPLIAAARMLAFVWYASRHTEASNEEAGAWALTNFVGFLADATEAMGKVLTGTKMSPAEKEAATAEWLRVKENYTRKQPHAE